MLWRKIKQGKGSERVEGIAIKLTACIVVFCTKMFEEA